MPAVRERMIRIRFLTAIAVGAFVTEGLADDPAKRDSAPYLAWGMASGRGNRALP